MQGVTVKLNYLVDVLQRNKAIAIAIFFVSSLAVGQSFLDQINVDNIRIDGNTVSSTDTDGNILLSPNGTGAVTVNTSFNADNLRLDGNTVSSTDTNGNIILNPDGIGKVNLVDETASRVLILNSSNNIVSSTDITDTELDFLNGLLSAAVGLTDTQILTNKDIDGATAADASRITLPSAVTATIDATTDKEATIAYDTTLNGAVTNDGAVWSLIGGVKDVSTETGTATLTLTQNIVLADSSSAAFSITLPTAVGNLGKEYTIKYTDSGYANAVTIDGDGTETIEGDTTTTIDTLGEALHIISDGANWQILQRRIDQEWKTVTLTTNLTNETIEAKERRLGENLEIDGYFTFSGTSASGDFRITIPHSLVMIVPGNDAQNLNLGTASYHDTGTTMVSSGIRVRFVSTTVFEITDGVTAMDFDSPITWTTGDTVYFRFTAPIVGWKGN